MQRGDQQLAQGSFDGALDTFQQMLEKGANYWWVYTRIGQCLYYLMRYEEAVQAFQKANSLQEDASTLSWMGWAYLKRNDYAEAVRQFERSQSLNPSLARPNFEGMGAAYYWLGEYDKSIECSSKAFEAARTEDEKTQIRYDLGFTHAAKANYEQAYYFLGRRSTIGIWVRKGVQGFKVELVHKNGPADFAGIVPGDEIVEFEGQPLVEVDLRTFNTEMISKATYGSTVKLKILRGGTYQDKLVVIGVSPHLPKPAKAAGEEKMEPASSDRGHEVQPITPRVADSDASATLSPLDISSYEIKPSVVAPDGTFNIVVEFRAQDPERKSSEVSVSFTYKILSGETVMYEAPPIEMRVKAGQPMVHTEELLAPKEKRTYKVTVVLRNGNFTKTESKEFRIE